LKCQNKKTSLLETYPYLTIATLILASRHLVSNFQKSVEVNIFGNEVTKFKVASVMLKIVFLVPI